MIIIFSDSPGLVAAMRDPAEKRMARQGRVYNIMGS